MARARNTATTIQDWLSLILTDTQKAMKDKGLDASGRTSRELSIESSKRNEASLIGPAHLIFLNVGRGPGKFPPIQNIQDWIQNKGLQGRDAQGRFIKQQSFVFLVRRKIAREGTEIFKDKTKGLEFQKILEKRLPDLEKEIGTLTAQLTAALLIESLGRSEAAIGRPAKSTGVGFRFE